ncbi:MAG: LOG family protein [Planctomycetota bacterium]
MIRPAKNDPNPFHPSTQPPCPNPMTDSTPETTPDADRPAFSPTSHTGAPDDLPANPDGARTGDAALVAQMDALLGDAGVSVDSLYGKRLREVVHTALKLHADGADGGEVKLISQSLKELRYALKVFRPYKHVRKVSIFGSARTPEDHPDYHACIAFGEAIARRGWMVITGAGDGIMRAGHVGAQRDASFGVSIRLPFETSANDVIVGDEKLITFRYFFTRKLMFLWQASAVGMFPGGYGTQDELYEALTLIQTGKAPMAPVVLCEPTPEQGGINYWKHWDNYTRKSLLEGGFISPEDLSLYHAFQDPEAAADHLAGFYRNYHSERFVRNRHVIRLRRPLTDTQVEALQEEFQDALLLPEGRFEQSPGPLDEERNAWPKLCRLHWPSNKRAYGTFRRLIDRVNEFDAQNHPGVTPSATLD